MIDSQHSLKHALIIKTWEARIASCYKLLSAGITVATYSCCTGIPHFMCFALLCFSDGAFSFFFFLFFFFTNWRQNPSPAKKLWLILLWYSLYYRGLELNPQYLQGIVFDSAKSLCQRVSRHCSLSSNILIICQDSGIGNSTECRWPEKHCLG